jgi:hypothetical protein
MKKIFLLFAAVSTLFACDPTHEDISNDGSISVDELIAKTTVSVDNDGNGHNGNIVTCSTSAPVNARWDIAGKHYEGAYTRAKLRVGDYNITLTGLCADGTEVKADFPIKCEVETEVIHKFWIYGEDPVKQPEFWLEPGDAGGGRFSANEGKYFPFLNKDTYFGLKTLVFEITDTQETPFIWGDGETDKGVTMRVMNGWWSSTYYDDIVPTKGYWELPITDKIAKECAATDDGGEGRDLDLLMTRGRIKIKACYYEY